MCKDKSGYVVDRAASNRAKKCIENSTWGLKTELEQAYANN